MCELFALTARAPTTVNLSLAEFSRHGGATGPHVDGWGVVYYEGRDVNLIRDVGPASDSDWVRFVADQKLRSATVISHIRKATKGPVTLANTQPFRRELGGMTHTFAHNGELEGLESISCDSSFPCLPLGETDSERAFCLLLKRMAELWRAAGGLPELPARLEVFAQLASELRPTGIANMIYSDGDALFVHGHKRHQADDTVGPPGLHMLTRACRVDRDAISGGGVTVEEGQEVTLFASVPLTAEAWSPLGEGEVMAAARGHIVAVL